MLVLQILGWGVWAFALAALFFEMGRAARTGYGEGILPIGLMVIALPYLLI